MTQYELPSPINPTTTSGSQLADILSGANRWRDALESLHKGGIRPTYAQAGMLWVDDSVATNWKLYVYDGSADILIGALDLTTGELVSKFTERFGRFNLLRWTTAAPQFGTEDIYSSVYIETFNRIIIVGAVSAAISGGAYSDDGETWAAVALGELGVSGTENHGVAVAPSLGAQGRLVAVSDYVGTFNGRYSDDGGVNWTTIVSGEMNQSDLWAVAWSPTLNRYISCGAQDGVVLTNSYSSTNGIAWSPLSFPTTGNGIMYAVAWCGDRFVMGGAGNTLPAGQDIFYSTDAISWAPVACLPTASLAYSPALGVIVAGTFTSGTIQYSTDGSVNWTSVNIGITGIISCMTWLPKLAHFVAGSLSGAGQTAISPNGVDWEVVPATGLTSGVLTAAEHDFSERAILAGFGGALSYSP